MMPIFKWHSFKTKAPLHYCIIRKKMLLNKLLSQNKMQISSLTRAYLNNIFEHMHSIATHICK